MYSPLKDLKVIWYAVDHNDETNLEAMNRLHRWIEGQANPMDTDLMAQLIYKEMELRITKDGRRTGLEALVDRCAEAKAKMDQYGSMNTFGLNSKEESEINTNLLMWQAAYWQARRELQNSVREFASAG